MWKNGEKNNQKGRGRVGGRIMVRWEKKGAKNIGNNPFHQLWNGQIKIFSNGKDPIPKK